MKKAAFLLATTIMAACCLIAWDATKDTVLRYESVKQEKLQQISTESVTEEEISTVTQELNTQEDETQKNEDEQEKIILDQNNQYAFSMLNLSEQKLYVDILSALLTFEENITLSTNSTEEIDKAFQCVLMDHPEIFYVDGYKYTKYTTGDEIKRITFTGNYVYGREEADEKRAEIETEALRIMNAISKDSTDYEKVKYIYETISNVTEYDLDAPDNQNICSVFLNKRPVCQGYAKAFQYLLNQLDVPTTLVIGTVKNGEGHAWNLALIDGNYYYVDPTWGDAYYLLSSQDIQATGERTPSINYDYLCVTTKQIEDTHTINSVVSMPQCKSMDANYYVMEGAYFTEYNEEMLKELFERAQKDGKEAVTLKCATNGVYSDMLKQLIENQKVFSFLPDLKGTVAYTNCEEQRSISFWL